MANIELLPEWNDRTHNLDIKIKKKKGKLNTAEIRACLKAWLKTSCYSDRERYNLFARFFLTEDEDEGFNDDGLDDGDFIVVTLLGSDEVCPVCKQKLPEKYME